MQAGAERSTQEIWMGREHLSAEGSETGINELRWAKI
jgi:hypothetical protein